MKKLPPKYIAKTFDRCINYERNPTQRNLDLLIHNLERWANHPYQLDDYGYTDEVMLQIEYCSDRMNSGRAKAILRLLKEKQNDSL